MHLNKRTDPLFSTGSIMEALNITLSHNLITSEECTSNSRELLWVLKIAESMLNADVAMNFMDAVMKEGEWNLEQRPLLWVLRFRDDIHIHGLTKKYTKLF